MKLYQLVLAFLGLLILGSCSSKKSLQTIDELNKEDYLGKWYEIQRFPHSFEKDLQCVSATYTKREDGKIGVINRGFDGDEWKDVEGKAWIPDNENPGELKVQFFWPFSGDYYIIETDTEKYSLVGTPDRDYLWILAREKILDDATISQLRSKAKALGFDISNLKNVSQDCKE